MLFLNWGQRDTDHMGYNKDFKTAPSPLHRKEKLHKLEAVKNRENGITQLQEKLDFM